MYLQVGDDIVSILGYRLTEQLAWGKAVYIDDFATLLSMRGLGYGSILLEWAIDKARAEQCQQIHLDTGPHRHAAHRLYIHYGFKLSAYHMVKNLDIVAV
jgi:GNAT superfamily N-acetyltransferase